MSAPLPLSGHNPFTRGYQTHQFKVESVSLPGSNALDANGLVSPQSVFDALANPPASGLLAEDVTPIEERADVAAHPQTGIVPN